MSSGEPSESMGTPGETPRGDTERASRTRFNRSAPRVLPRSRLEAVRTAGRDFEDETHGELGSEAMRSVLHGLDLSLIHI